MPEQTTGKVARTKPKKSVLKKIAKPVLAITLVITLAAAWVIVSVLTAKPYPDPTARADMLAITRNAQPDPAAPNRYPEFVEALLAFDEFTDRIANEERDADQNRSPYAHLAWEAVIAPERSWEDDPETIEQQAASVRRAMPRFSEERAFDRIHELLQSPNLAATYLVSSQASRNNTLLNPPGAPPAPSDTVLPFLSSWLNFANAVATAIHLDIESGRINEAAEMLERSSRLPAVVTRFSTLVEIRSGHDIVEMLARGIERAANHPNLDRESLESLQATVQNFNNLGDPASGLDAELIFIRDTLSQFHTKSGRYIPSELADDESHLIPANNDSGGSDPPLSLRLKDSLKDVSGLFDPRRDTVYAAISRAYEMYKPALIEPDPAKREAITQAASAELAKARTMNEVAEQVAHSITPRLFIARSIRTVAQTRALEILLAMAENRLDHGEWPAALNQLVPDYLDAIPVNPLTGDPFEYDHQPGEPPSLERLGIKAEFVG